jgi:putative oxidoreductase
MHFLASLHQFNDFALLPLRIALASIFIAHGMAKGAMWKAQPSEQMPKQMISLMKLLSICEPLGGLAVLAGFLTQPATLGLGLIMLGAMFLKITKFKAPFITVMKPGWGYDLILFLICLSLYFTGAGAISFDRVLFGL